MYCDKNYIEEVTYEEHYNQGLRVGLRGRHQALLLERCAALSTREIQGCTGSRATFFKIKSCCLHQTTHLREVRVEACLTGKVELQNANKC